MGATLRFTDHGCKINATLIVNTCTVKDANATLSVNMLTVTVAISICNTSAIFCQYVGGRKKICLTTVKGDE